MSLRAGSTSGVSHVINYELPNVPEQYVHRIGRTARAGKDGIAIAFCAEDERDYLKDIRKKTDAEFERLPLPDNFRAVVEGVGPTKRAAASVCQAQGSPTGDAASGPSPRTSIPPARAVPAARAVGRRRKRGAGRPAVAAAATAGAAAPHAAPNCRGGRPFPARFPVHSRRPRKGCGLVVGQPFEHPFADVAAQVEQRGRILRAHQQPHLDRIAPRVGHLHHLHTAVPARIVRDLAFEFGADRADPGRRVEIEHHRTQQLRGFLGPVLERAHEEVRCRHDQPPLVPNLDHHIGRADVLDPPHSPSTITTSSILIGSVGAICTPAISDLSAGCAAPPTARPARPPRRPASPRYRARRGSTAAPARRSRK